MKESKMVRQKKIDKLLPIKRMKSSIKKVKKLKTYGIPIAAATTILEECNELESKQKIMAVVKLLKAPWLKDQE